MSNTYNIITSAGIDGMRITGNVTADVIKIGSSAQQIIFKDNDVISVTKVSET